MPIVSSEIGPATDRMVLVLAGSIDAVTAPKLSEVVDVAADGGIRDFVFDCTEVEYVDSSALGLLISVDHRVRPSGGSVTLLGVAPSVMRIIELAGMLDVVPSLSVLHDDSEPGAGEEALPDLVECARFYIDRMPENLSHMRDRVVDLVSDAGIDEGALFDLKVAFGEALSNALSHGRGPDGSVDVTVAVERFTGGVRISVSDSGNGYDGSTESPSDPLSLRGRGVRFMRALVDEVAFERRPEGGTVVRLVKRA